MLTQQSKLLARKDKTPLRRRNTSRSPPSNGGRQLGLWTRQDQFFKSIGAFFLSEQKVIVVVDDDLDILHSLELVLSLCGYHIELFASAEEFLRAAPALEAACLVVDIQLGDSSGLELIRTLCAQGCAVPVIFITGSQDELHRRRAMELGCAAFLLKPFSAELTIETVRKAIGSKLN